jgi:hypothetical protein
MAYVKALAMCRYFILVCPQPMLMKELMYKFYSTTQESLVMLDCSTIANLPLMLLWVSRHNAKPHVKPCMKD